MPTRSKVERIEKWTWWIHDQLQHLSTQGPFCPLYPFPLFPLDYFETNLKHLISLVKVSACHLKDKVSFLKPTTIVTVSHLNLKNNSFLQLIISTNIRYCWHFLDCFKIFMDFVFSCINGFAFSIYIVSLNWDPNTFYSLWLVAIGLLSLLMTLSPSSLFFSCSTLLRKLCHLPCRVFQSLNFISSWCCSSYVFYKFFTRSKAWSDSAFCFALFLWWGRGEIKQLPRWWCLLRKIPSVVVFLVMVAAIYDH